jgi:hypothetical protein
MRNPGRKVKAGDNLHGFTIDGEMNFGIVFLRALRCFTRSRSDRGKLSCIRGQAEKALWVLPASST